jgi:phosphate transport system ATP-binding protein
MTSAEDSASPKRHANDASSPPVTSKLRAVAEAPTSQAIKSQLKMRAADLTVAYSEKTAIKDVSIDVHGNQVLALIGPSGCGKSTFLRSLNRMNDTVPGVSVTGHVELDGEAIYGDDVDPVLVRRRVGMVFQRSNRTRFPSPSSKTSPTAFASRACATAVS